MAPTTLKQCEAPKQLALKDTKPKIIVQKAKKQCIQSFALTLNSEAVCIYHFTCNYSLLYGKDYMIDLSEYHYRRQHLYAY